MPENWHLNVRWPYFSLCRLHAIAVSDNAAYFYEHCDETLEEVGMGHLKSQSLMRIVDGYKGKGYGLSTNDELGITSALFVFSLSFYSSPLPSPPQPHIISQEQGYLNLAHVVVF